MNKKIIIIPIIATVVIVLAIFSSDKTEKSVSAFHVTLADPNLYVDGVYTQNFTLEPGEYLFSFVPNGSSPKVLSIAINGDAFNFSEDFQRVGMPHQTGISEYFTWDYDGQKTISISDMQEVSIVIDPNGETLGSVSVYLFDGTVRPQI